MHKNGAKYSFDICKKRNGNFTWNRYALNTKFNCKSIIPKWREKIEFKVGTRVRERCLRVEKLNYAPLYSVYAFYCALLSSKVTLWRRCEQMHVIFSMALCLCISLICCTNNIASIIFTIFTMPFNLVFIRQAKGR